MLSVTSLPNTTFAPPHAQKRQGIFRMTPIDHTASTLTQALHAACFSSPERVPVSTGVKALPTIFTVPMPPKYLPHVLNTVKHPNPDLDGIYSPDWLKQQRLLLLPESLDRKPNSSTGVFWGLLPHEVTAVVQRWMATRQTQSRALNQIAPSELIASAADLSKPHRRWWKRILKPNPQQYKPIPLVYSPMQSLINLNGAGFGS